LELWNTIEKKTLQVTAIN